VDFCSAITKQAGMEHLFVTFHCYLEFLIVMDHFFVVKLICLDSDSPKEIKVVSTKQFSLFLVLIQRPLALLIVERHCPS